MSEHNSKKPPPNLWALSSDRNPYLHNVFALLQIDPDDGVSTLLSKCRRLSRQLEAGLSLSAQGRRIEETDIARGHYLAANAEEFVAERLLAHTVHTIDPREFKTQMEAIESIPFDRPESLLPLPLNNLSFLTRLLPELPELKAETPKPFPPEMLGGVARPQATEEHVYDF
jgi:hypothetical protein